MGGPHCCVRMGRCSSNRRSRCSTSTRTTRPCSTRSGSVTSVCRRARLRSISTYAAPLAGVPVDQLPVPDSAASAQAFWCGLVTEAGLNCVADFGSAPLTLPVLSFAGVDVEQADFLGALIDGATDLSGTPIGSTPSASSDIGDVPLASQPLVPSKSCPRISRRPSTSPTRSWMSRWVNSVRQPRSAALTRGPGHRQLRQRLCTRPRVPTRLTAGRLLVGRSRSGRQPARDQRGPAGSRRRCDSGRCPRPERARAVGSARRDHPAERTGPR